VLIWQDSYPTRNVSYGFVIKLRICRTADQIGKMISEKLVLTKLGKFLFMKKS